jgi:lipopolysaccharide biosynthesis regulator YciM
VDEAIACYRQAIASDPCDANASIALGYVLVNVKRDYDGAIACYRQAIASNPRAERIHCDLGKALQIQGQVDEAIACYKKALEIGPRDAMASGALGQLLLGKGLYAEARDASARALELLPENDPRRAFASQQLRTCARLLELDRKLPAILDGAQPRDAAELADLANLCLMGKKCHVTAARFYAAALSAEPNLAGQHRYDAARAAVLAASGKGQDANQLKEGEPARLRQLALHWLRAELAGLKQQLAAGPNPAAAAGETLKHWQSDRDLATVRESKELSKLSEAERNEWEQLWAEVKQ